MTRKILKIREVEERTGKKKSSIYQAVRAGTFPAQISLGPRASGWLNLDIERWLDERIHMSKIAKNVASE